MGESPDVESCLPAYDVVRDAKYKRRIGRLEVQRVPRYMVERTFPAGLQVIRNEQGVDVCQEVIDRNAEVGVTWIHSYVSEDSKKTFCVYDGPSPEAIRKAAERSRLPVDRIIRVTVLDPYSYP